VSQDKTAYEEMISLTHTGAVPQISIDGAMIIGFQEQTLRAKLGIP